MIARRHLTSSAVGQPCLDPQSTCCQELGGAVQVFRRSPQLVGVDSSCGHNWCLCFRQMGQSWRMWWIVCSASLQSQSAESVMPVRFRCARRPQCPVRNLNIVVCSCLARGLIESAEGCNLQWSFSIDTFDCFRVGFWPPGKWRWTEVAVVCSQTWPGDLLFHFLESHGGLGSTVGSRCIHVGEAAGLSAVGGLAGQGYWR